MVKIPIQNILLIEDNPADIETVRRAIDASDFKVQLDIIKSGEEAKRKLQNHSLEENNEDYKLVLLDLNLPGNDGRELLTHFSTNGNWSNVPIVILTTSENNEDIQHAYRNGANAYIVKPGSHQQFVEKIKSICHFLFNTKTNQKQLDE